MKPKKKAVALKFDDGTEAKVTDMRALKAYAVSKLMQEHIANLSKDPTVDWPALAKLKEQGKARSIEVKKTKRINASQPRNEFARKPTAQIELLEFKNQFGSTNATTHGWQKAACEKFLVDPDTLKRILARKAD